MKTFSIKERADIINLIKHIQTEVDLNHKSIDYEFGSKFSASSNSDSSHHIIELYKNKEITQSYKKEIMDNLSFGLSEYFYGMKITSDLHYCAFYIQSVLHEFGHIKQYEPFQYAIDLIDISMTTRAILNKSRNNLNATDKRQNSYTELYAEKFAYRWFPIIWNKFNEEIIKILKIEEKEL